MNNGRNRIAQHLPPEARGGVLLTPTVDLNLVCATMLACSEAIASWMDVGEVIEQVRKQCDDPPNARQQATLNALSALAVCQVSLRDAIAANTKALHEPTILPEEPTT